MNSTWLDEKGIQREQTTNQEDLDVRLGLFFCYYNFIILYQCNSRIKDPHECNHITYHQLLAYCVSRGWLFNLKIKHTDNIIYNLHLWAMKCNEVNFVSMILLMHNEIVNISVRKVFNNRISNFIYKLIFSIMTILANYRLKSAHVNIINRSSHFSLLHHNNQISPNYTVFSVNSSPNYELYQIIE